jgi:hypothetical protein
MWTLCNAVKSFPSARNLTPVVQLLGRHTDWAILALYMCCAAVECCVMLLTKEHKFKMSQTKHSGIYEGWIKGEFRVWGSIPSVGRLANLSVLWDRHVTLKKVTRNSERWRILDCRKKDLTTFHWNAMLWWLEIGWTASDSCQFVDYDINGAELWGFATWELSAVIRLTARLDEAFEERRNSQLLVHMQRVVVLDFQRP